MGKICRIFFFLIFDIFLFPVFSSFYCSTTLKIEKEKKYYEKIIKILVTRSKLQWRENREEKKLKSKGGKKTKKKYWKNVHP